MAFDQNINYRVTVDDSNFQAKLTQMRASMDSTVGGFGGGMGAGGFAQSMAYMGNSGFGAGSMALGGMADFGSQIRPITYTPPAIAMQPHFGMVSVHQTLGRAGLTAMLGPTGAAIGQNWTNFRQGGISGLINGPDPVPLNISMAEYMAQSSRYFGAAMGDNVAMAGMTAANLGTGLAAGAAGTAFGASLFSSGLGMAAGGLVFGAAAGTLVSKYFDQVTDQMAENRGIQTSLESGSFRFLNGPNADPLTGRGMNHRDRVDAARFIQDESMNDLRYGIREYRQVLEAGMQMDSFSGTRDIDDFKTKFKNLVETVKTVQTTLHTSLKEGIETVRGFRDIGVTDPSQITNLVMGSEIRGRASGRTGMEMVALGQQGAEIFRGTGVRMGLGFESMQNNVVDVRNLLNQGLISRETVAQAGGENALASKMTANSLSSVQTAFGRAAMMANYDAKTNTLDPNMISNLSGSSSHSVAMNASRLSVADMMKLQANQENLISSMDPEQMRMVGITSRMGVAQNLMSVTGADFETSYRIAGQYHQMDKAMIDTELATMKQDPQQWLNNRRQGMQSVATQAGMQDIANRFNIGRRIGNWWDRTLVRPAADIGTSVSSAIEGKVEDLGLWFQGAANTRIDASLDTVEAGGKLISQRRVGGILNADAGMMSMFRDEQSANALGLDISKEGTFDAKTGEISYRGQTLKSFASMEDMQSYAEKNGVMGTAIKNISIAGTGNRYTFVTSSQVASQVRASQNLDVSDADRKKIADRDITDAQFDRIYSGRASMTPEEAVAILSENTDGKAAYTYSDLQKSAEQFRKDTGLDHGQEKARLERALKLTNSQGALKKVLADRVSSHAVDAVAATAEEAAKIAASAKDELETTFTSAFRRGSNLSRNGGGDGFTLYDTKSEKALEIGSLLDSEKGLDIIGIATDRKLSATDAQREILRQKNVDIDLRAIEAWRASSNSISERSLYEKAAANAAFAADSKGAAIGLERTDKNSKEFAAMSLGGTSTGAVSAEVAKNILQMSNQLMSQYNALITMQKQLNNLQGKGAN
jgi:hypothetical protein